MFHILVRCSVWVVSSHSVSSDQSLNRLFSCLGPHHFSKWPLLCWPWRSVSAKSCQNYKASTTCTCTHTHISQSICFPSYPTPGQAAGFHSFSLKYLLGQRHVFFFLATINSILTQTTCGKGVRKNPEWGELESGLMFHSVVTKSQHGSALNYYTSHEYPRGKKTYRL